ncbi:CehA/McbA family metallohydrolase [Dactylosporangium siamense]|uniref:Polymerase/histidinol phosphatase N-terminal domain-containing protein n=1 Tax=Dactylosporangium siamense TaxID=685454 RepID=A0A919UBX9_9ACTN|nr:CehA/McbA family metallohydrolase [Dactylosporangium siamense]GIG46136.1 hypothetical protein Dsi01nite_041770 [Dactylosporangium siamense]
MTHDHSHGDDHSHGVDRRGLLAAGAGGLLLLAAPGSAYAAESRTARAETGTAATVGAGPAALTGAARASAITAGTALVHADLHNHTVMSDGDGDPNLAFASMRSAGLDVAALTDHATLFSISGLSKSEWDRTGALANAADDPGNYTAIRGFEWSHPLLGHVNVWFTNGFTDLGGSSNMGGLYNWIVGNGGVASFNHPGREIARFGNFSYSAAARDAMVSLEMFNRGDDYLFDGWSEGRTSALNACLNAGWRTGISGVSDEHGTDWGFPEGKGRTGLWVTQNTRAGVLEAMRARRFFATRVSGLRVDATANDVRMGGVLPLARGDVRFALDLNRGPDWDGKPIRVQVLRPGVTAPTVADVIDTVANQVVRFTVPLDAAMGNWVVLRVSDPTQPNPSPGPNGHPCNDFGLAYSSPWWLQP